MIDKMDSCMFCPVDENNVLAVWEVTRHCDLKCPHCCSQSGTDYNPTYRDLSEDEAMRVLDLIYREGYGLLYISGGEPLLWPHLVKIVRKALDYGIECHIATSGFSQPATVLEELFSLPVSSFHVSLDSCREEEHDAFRGVPGAFRKAVDFIKLCKVHGKEVVTSSIISDSLVQNIDDMLALLKNIGVDRATLNFLVPLGRAGMNGVKILPTSEKIRIAEYLFQEGKKIGIPVTTNRIRRGQTLLSECPAGKYMVHINALGEVSPCSWVGKLWGDLVKKPMDRLFDEEVLSVMRQRFQEIYGEKCGACAYTNSCGKGCPIIAWFEDEHYDKLCGF